MFGLHKKTKEEKMLGAIVWEIIMIAICLGTCIWKIGFLEQQHSSIYVPILTILAVIGLITHVLFPLLFEERWFSNLGYYLKEYVPCATITIIACANPTMISIILMITFCFLFREFIEEAFMWSLLAQGIIIHLMIKYFPVFVK